MPPSHSQDSDLGFPFSSKKFNDPFLLNSNLYAPKDFYTALEFALYLAVQNPTYTKALDRIVSHFITDFEFVGKSGDQRERDELKDYLINELNLLDCLKQGGLEQLIYGNSFMRIHYPFDRYIVDRRNGRYRQINIKTFGDDVTFNLQKMTYNVPDPDTLHLPLNQRKREDFEFIDKKSHNAQRIKIMFLNPTRMAINMNFISGSCEYIYRFDEFFRAAVSSGHPIHQIHETPMDMLQAIRADQDFVFNPGAIFHFKSPFISGLSFNGWGIPGILLNYNDIHHMQVMRCINEAIGLDYLLPIRLLSPAASSQQGGMDVAGSTNLAPWMASMRQLIGASRKDKTAMHAVPFPVMYQELGANGKALAPVDLMKFYQEEMLTGAGAPVQLWKMDLQTAQIPSAIRLFENSFMHVHRALNMGTRFAVTNILNYLEKEQIGIKMQLPSTADDMEKRHIMLQLAAGGEVSRATAYRGFNISDPVEEVTRRAQEDIAIQKSQKHVQENFEREMTLGSADQLVGAMMQGQQGPGGVSPAPAAGGNVTPLDIEQQAEEQAAQLLGIQDVGERRKMMMQIKASNPTLYAVVQRKMEDMRQQGASEGRKSVGQQQG